MNEAAALPVDEQTSLADSRAQFVASLGRRLQALRAALTQLEQAPESPIHRDNLRRRVHAMSSAASVLDFARVAAALRTVEEVLSRGTEQGRITPADLRQIASTLDRVPSLVLGARVVAGEGARLPEAVEGAGWPVCVLAFASAALGETLAEAAAARSPLESICTEDPAQVLPLARALAPDVAVVDIDRPEAHGLIEALMHDPTLEPARIIAIGSFDRPEGAASLVQLGVARVLAKPLSEETLHRSIREVASEALLPRRRAEPIGDVTLDALVDRISTDIRRGLLDSVRAGGRDALLPLGEGTEVLAAVWGMVARLRELLTLRSGDTLQFEAGGPEGAMPLAPWLVQERHQRGAEAGRAAQDVPLEGRRAVVVDDDPAVVWFMAGLLKAVGFEVLEAHDGDTALELAMSTWPDVVISDVLMPGLDGFSLCRRIKRDVALSDVPVVLLSWKEDLLQRIRELGADADGYLRKEASGSVVIQRVREVLRKRARLEARMAAGDEVRGRLDDLTPRLVLELACRRGVDLRIEVRDAASLYDVEIRGGRLCSVSRSAADGKTERGAAALSALLGVRAGRFAMTKSSGECRRDFEGVLQDVLAAPLSRARAAQDALSGEALSEVARVELDEAALAPYLDSMPESSRQVVAQLLDGNAPRTLLERGVSPTLLDAVLSDLARHGTVRAVWGDDGSDRLLAQSPPARPAVVLTAPDERAPLPPETVEDALVPGAGPGVPAPDGERPAGLTTGAALASEHPVQQEAAPSVPVAVDPRLPEVRPIARPVKAVVSPRHRPAPPEEPVTRSSAPPVIAPPEEPPFEIALLNTPPAETKVAEVGDGNRRAPGEDGVPGDEPARAAQDQPSPPRTGPNGAAAERGGPTPEPVRAPGWEIVFGDDEASARPAPVHRVGSTPLAPARAPSREREQQASAQQGSAGADATREAPGNESPPAAERPGSSGAPLDKDAPLDKAEEEPELADAVAALMGALDPAVHASGVDQPRTDRAVEHGNGGSGAEQDRTPDPVTAALVEPEGRGGEGGDANEDAPATAAPAPEGSVQPSGAVTERPRPPLQDEGAAAGGQDSPGPRGEESLDSVSPSGEVRTPSGEETGSWISIAALTVAAGVAAFFLVRAVAPLALAPAEPDVAAATEPAPASPAGAVETPAEPGPPGAPSTGGRAETSSEDGAFSLSMVELELPAGVDVSGDKGLLEVDTGDRHAIYVDGVFVGRGPLRRIPLTAGRHEVRLSLDGREASRKVDLRPGRRARLAAAAEDQQ